jgi:hypothetical protein
MYKVRKTLSLLYLLAFLGKHNRFDGSHQLRQYAVYADTNLIGIFNFCPAVILMVKQRFMHLPGKFISGPARAYDRAAVIGTASRHRLIAHHPVKITILAAEINGTQPVSYQTGGHPHALLFFVWYEMAFFFSHGHRSVHDHARGLLIIIPAVTCVMQALCMVIRPELQMPYFS